MNIFKLYDEKKFFEISFSEKVDDEDLPYISEIIESSFDMSKKTKLLIPVIKREGITIDCNHTTYLASINVVADDQKGLLAYISKVFDDYGIEIETAKLSSIKGKAQDMFLIEKNGNFCAKQEEIIRDLCVDEN